MRVSTIHIKLMRLAALNKQMEDLRMADETGNYTTTWKIIHTLSGKNTSKNLKVKKRDGTSPSSEQELLEEWKVSFRVSAAWKSHGKWFLFSRPGKVMEFVKNDESHGKVMEF